ncbi:hypothetical protein TeGR_g4999, partial [Tetraparma gracilis]
PPPPPAHSRAQVVDAVKAVASRQPEGADMLFFYATTGGGVVDRVRDLCKISDAKFRGDAVMVKLDIPDNGGYYVSDCSDISAEAIEKFMASPGERRQLE